MLESRSESADSASTLARWVSQMGFESALLELSENDGPLERGVVAMLSGPTRAEIEIFAARWGQISSPRRRKITAWMLELAEERFELDYTALFRHCLGDADSTVRRQAIEGLWEDEGPDLVEPLLELLSSDPDPMVRAAAATSLGRFLFLAECDQLDQRRAELIRQALERTIEDPDEQIEVVRRAVESIAYINDVPVRRIIDRAYCHGDSRMRESALFAMGRSAEHFWAETVLAELYADSPAMRFEAARSCGEIELGAAVGRLIDLVADPDPEVRGMAVWALGQIGGDRSQKVLESLAGGEDELLSTLASEALDEMRFLTRPLELLVHSPEGGGSGEIDLLDTDQEADPTGRDALDSHDDAWEDDLADLE